MEFSVAQTYLSDILHAVSQALLAPDIILLLAFIGYALFSIGSIIVEGVTERKHFKVVMPQFLAALTAADEEGIPKVIEESGLLRRQKDALNTVYEYRALPGDALLALIRRLVSEEETRCDRIVGRNNMAAKVAPMLGLMGTLIPLGPGIQALGQADTAALSSSLLVAFDTTVAGLVTAAVCLIVGKVRSNWYNNYLSALDAAMATMLEKIEANRENSTAELPDPRVAEVAGDEGEAGSDAEARETAEQPAEPEPVAASSADQDAKPEPEVAPVPEPEPEPVPEPEPEPELEPEPALEPEPEPEPAPVAAIELEQAFVSEPTVEPGIALEPELEPQPEPGSASASQPTRPAAEPRSINIPSSRPRKGLFGLFKR